MKTMGRRLGILLCVALALLSAFYAFAVMKARSGTGFWMVWLAIAACLILLTIGIAADWWSNFPRLVQDIIVSLVFIALVVFGTVEGCVISRMTEQASTDLDYVVVLGAQVRASGPSKVLRYRLDTAIEYLNENPKTICIVSGGRGVNEPFPEAQGMADYLEEHGIEKDRILKETKSRTTQENISNSSGLITKPNAEVGIITNDFHMFRALQIAHKNGLVEAQGIAAGSPRDMLANNMLREFFAEIKFLFS
ncbi:ElyC/SanA/YdcF family protein [uncultured Bifidobacterium sp.]|uniref:ElyC/SanA/YdcF family protein n=1 Tax=uncultured Bifidobacterium sp. TaxID=165187 RepID=UPI00280B6B73|nr:ElyC/SanA/YdcF family protein [uncultured Bifidobacterium sp.]